MNMEYEKTFRELARINYPFYVQYAHEGAYKHANHTKLITQKVHDLLTDQTEKDRLMVFLPPRHSKSQSISETAPSWFIGNNPDKRVILASYGASLAAKFGRRNRTKMEKFGESVFGIRINDRNSSVTDWGIDGANGGMLSVGVGGSITGEGADLLIVDDPIKNRQEADSIVYRERLWSEWEDTLSTRLQKGAKVILILTRWHEDDLAGRLLEREPEKWDVLSIPAVSESEDDPLGREIGEGLWIDHFGQEYYTDKEEKTPARSWNSLWQQRPTSADGDIVRREWIKYYSTLPSLSKADNFILSWDMAFDDASKDSSYVVGQAWAQFGADKYLVDQVRAQMDFPTTKQAFVTFTQKHESKAREEGFRKSIPKLVEKKANGPAIISSLNSVISGIIPISPQGSKEARFEAVSPEFKGGNVYIPESASWTYDYVDEIVSFPGSKHNDQVDTTSQSLEYLLQKPKVVMGGKVVKA